LLHKFLAREEDTALYSTYAKIEFVGYFAVLVTLGVHFEWDAEVVGELFDGVGQFVYRGALVGLEIRSTIVEYDLVVGRIEGCVFTRIAPVVVDKRMSHDGKEPCAEIGSGLIGVLKEKCP